MMSIDDWTVISNSIPCGTRKNYYTFKDDGENQKLKENDLNFCERRSTRKSQNVFWKDFSITLKEFIKMH